MNWTFRHFRYKFFVKKKPNVPKKNLFGLIFSDNPRYLGLRKLIILYTIEYEGTAYVSWSYKVVSSSILLSCCSEQMNRWKVQHSWGHKYSFNITLTSHSNCLRFSIFVFVSEISNACKTLGTFARPVLLPIKLLRRRKCPFTLKSLFLLWPKICVSFFL